MSERFLVNLDDSEAAYELRRDADGRLLVCREGSEAWKEVALSRVGDSGLYLLMVDNRPMELYLERRRGGATVTIGRHVFEATVGPWRPEGARRSIARGAAGRAAVKAPMTGSIVEVRVQPGERVEKGDVVLIIESMKMNNELRSPASGTVESVAVRAGDRVKQGDVLVTVDAGEAGTS